MKKVTEFNADWLCECKETDGQKAFSDTVITLPFFHEADRMPEVSFKKNWIPDEKDDGRAVYLEFSCLSGESQIFFNGELVGEVDGSLFVFRTLLTNYAHWNENCEIRINVKPFARPDGLFVMGSVKLIVIDPSHFNKTQYGNGILTECFMRDGKNILSVTADIVKPNNYDVVSYQVTDKKGKVLASKTCKPTAPDTEIEIDFCDKWDGQSGPFVYTLNSKLLRDSRTLDEIKTDFGFRKIELKNDGFLYLNGFKLPLSGVSLSDCSAVKSDIENLKLLDGNILSSNLLPIKTDILSLCDSLGCLFWYEMTLCGNEEKDINTLKDFLYLYKNHPSLSAVIFPENTENEKFSRLNGVLKKTSPSVFSVIKRDIESAIESIPESADIVMLLVPFKNTPDAFISYTGRISEILEKYPDKFLCILPKNPQKTECSVEEHDEWHIRLWNTFCRQKGVIAFFGGMLSDGKNAVSKRGLTGDDRRTLYDVFWYYKSQFSAKGFIKICSLPESETEEKTVDIKCITNCPNPRILVNGKDKKYKADTVTDGVYVFKGIKLKRDLNLIEVSAGDECDSIELFRI